jgi:hypothetical protein
MGGIGGIADFFTNLERTTGSGGFEYAAGSITSVFAYRILKTLDCPVRVRAEALPAFGRVIGISPR